MADVQINVEGKDSQRGEHYCTARVCFEQREDAERAMCTENGKSLKTLSQQMVVHRFLNNGRLWVADISPFVTSENLKEAFQQFGGVKDAMVSKGRFSSRHLSQVTHT